MAETCELAAMKRWGVFLLCLAVAAASGATAQTPRRQRAPSTPEESIRAAEEKRAARIAELERNYDAQLDAQRSLRDRDDRREARARERASKRLAQQRGLTLWQRIFHRRRF
jgi:hypothetical protein